MVQVIDSDGVDPYEGEHVADAGMSPESPSLFGDILQKLLDDAEFHDPLATQLKRINRVKQICKDKGASMYTMQTVVIYVQTMKMVEPAAFETASDTASEAGSAEAGSATSTPIKTKGPDKELVARYAALKEATDLLIYQIPSIMEKLKACKIKNYQYEESHDELACYMIMEEFGKYVKKPLSENNNIIAFNRWIKKWPDGGAPAASPSPSPVASPAQ
jgi:hypothetical protein